MDRKDVLKDNRGQVLLMVLITSTIALIIVTGVFIRVLRLIKSDVEKESHEIAFSTAEKYVSKIMDLYEQGTLPGQSDVDGIIDTADSVVIDIDDDVSSLAGINVNQFETYEMVQNSPKINSVAKIQLEDGSVNNILVTVVFYNSVTNTYSIKKKLFVSCNTYSGDLTRVSCLNNTVSYVYIGSEKSVRFKFLGGAARFTASNTSGPIARKYTITTRENAGAGSSALSETVLYLLNNKSMPSLFDYVLFNGTETIDKLQ